MKKAILLFLVAMLLVWPIALAQETEGEMTTYVVTEDADETADEPVDDASEDATGDAGEDTTEEVEETTDAEAEEELTDEATEDETSEEETGAEDETADEDEAVEEDEEEVDEPIVDLPEEVVEEAGITPDSPLYGLERAMERISLKLTLGKSAKAKKGLAHAAERLAEVQAMIAAKKMGAAAEAQEEHDDIMDEVNEEIADLGNGDIGEELTAELELEAALEEHEEAVQAVNAVKLKAKGQLSEAQQAELNAVVASLQASAVKAKINVQAKKDKTKIKIKAESGLTDEQLNALETQARQIVGEGGKVKIQAKKEKAAKVKSGDDAEEDEAEDSDAEEPEAETESEDSDAVEPTAKAKKPKKNK